jgi:Myb-like DNA-binding domain
MPGTVAVGDQAQTSQAPPHKEHDKKKKKMKKSKNIVEPNPFGPQQPPVHQGDIPVPQADDEFIDPSLTNPETVGGSDSLSTFPGGFGGEARSALPTLFGPSSVSSAPPAPSPFDTSFDFSTNLPLFDESHLGADDDTILRAIQNVQMTPTSRPSGSSTQQQTPAKSTKSKGQQGTLSEPTTRRSEGGKRGHRFEGISNKDIIQTKWLSATELNKVAAERGEPALGYFLGLCFQLGLMVAARRQNRGFNYKKGKFTQAEKNTLDQALRDYKERNELDDEQLSRLIFAKGQDQRGDRNFWPTITCALEDRPVLAVYNHLQRSKDPRRKQGFFKPEEDDALRTAVKNFGLSWQKVAEYVGRTAGDCRDRYRNYLQIETSRVTGSWTGEEEARLKAAVAEVQGHLGKDEKDKVFWGTVAQKLGNTRSRQQCRSKW